MTKLEIGTVKPKKEEKKDDYYGELSDEELQTIQEEVEAITEETVEVAPITEEIIEEIMDEEEAEEAINGVDILDKAGIHADYIKKFTELYPKKKIIYHFLITKQFLEWYIKNAKPSLLNKLEIISEYINPVQQANFLKLIKKRLQEDVEIEEVKTDVKQETGVNLKTEQEIEMYELLLNEKWDKNRAKGIIELDSLIMEQLRLKEIFTIQEALEFLIETFKLDKKLKTIEKKEEKLIEKIKPKTPTKKEKRMSPAEQKANIKHSITYFRHIKFLYKLMSKKMIFAGEILTQEEIKQIETIKDLIENRTELTPAEKKRMKKKSQKKSQKESQLDNFLEGE
nr:MAG: hypothetical protein [uncultured archaeon]